MTGRLQRLKKLETLYIVCFNVCLQRHDLRTRNNIALYFLRYRIVYIRGDRTIFDRDLLKIYTSPLKDRLP